jgi:hypothetical protein
MTPERQEQALGQGSGKPRNHSGGDDDSKQGVAQHVKRPTEGVVRE